MYVCMACTWNFIYRLGKEPCQGCRITLESNKLYLRGKDKVNQLWKTIKGKKWTWRSRELNRVQLSKVCMEECTVGRAHRRKEGRKEQTLSKYTLRRCIKTYVSVTSTHAYIHKHTHTPSHPFSHSNICGRRARCSLASRLYGKYELLKMRILYVSYGKIQTHSSPGETWRTQHTRAKFQLTHKTTRKRTCIYIHICMYTCITYVNLFTEGW